MPQKKVPVHYVCTYQEAKKLIEERNEFWISNCGCRQRNKKGCNKSGTEFCLSFTDSAISLGKSKIITTKEKVRLILNEALNCKLVPRPFRDANRVETDGLCFCCDDCCYYFLDSNEICDMGKFVEKTDMSKCNHCGICEDVCYFNARNIKKGQLYINHKQCYGCGLCVQSCPVNCVQMIKRIST